MGRYGGDEFLFIIPGRSATSAYEFGEKFRSAIEETRLISPAGEAVSVGVAEAGPGGKQAVNDVIEQADQSMYVSKRAGGNRVSAPFEPTEAASAGQTANA